MLVRDQFDGLVGIGKARRWFQRAEVREMEKRKLTLHNLLFHNLIVAVWVVPGVFEIFRS